MPSAALIASGSKVASFFIFRQGHDGRVCRSGGERQCGTHYVSGWVPVLAIVAALSMVLGQLGGDCARAMCKRLLAYSAIAHAGYMLLGGSG